MSDALSALRAGRSIEQRISALNEYVALVRERDVGEDSLSELWRAAQDLLNSPNDVARQAVFRFICTCAAKQETHFGAIRSSIFRRIVQHEGDELWRIEAVSLLTQRGRDVQPFMPELGQLLVGWVGAREAEQMLYPYLCSLLKHSFYALEGRAVSALTQAVCERMLSELDSSGSTTAMAPSTGAGQGDKPGEGTVHEGISAGVANGAGWGKLGAGQARGRSTQTPSTRKGLAVAIMEQAAAKARIAAAAARGSAKMKAKLQAQTQAKSTAGQQSSSNRVSIRRIKRYLTFFEATVSYGSVPLSCAKLFIATLCAIVNTESKVSWQVVRTMLKGSAGHRSLALMLELLTHPAESTTNVLRGAVYFVAMSSWGSQRVETLQYSWCEVLAAFLQVLRSNDLLVVFEVVLSVQRLIGKYGASLRNEWDVLLPMFRTELLEWPGRVSQVQTARRSMLARSGSSLASGSAPSSGSGLTSDNAPSTSSATDTPPSSDRGSGAAQTMQSQPQLGEPVAGGAIPVQLRRSRQRGRLSHSDRMKLAECSQEILAIVASIVALHVDGKFFGMTDDLMELLLAFRPYLKEPTLMLVLRHQASLCHPAHPGWLGALEVLLAHFLGSTIQSGAQAHMQTQPNTNANTSVSTSTMPTRVRCEALTVLKETFHASKSVCDERVIEGVMLPHLNHIWDDRDALVRERGLELLIEAAGNIFDMQQFQSLLDHIETAIFYSAFAASKEAAIAGVVSLFASTFHSLPSSRPRLLYQLLGRVLREHKDQVVRISALDSLHHVCRANRTMQLLWSAPDALAAPVQSCNMQASPFLFATKVPLVRFGGVMPVADIVGALLAAAECRSVADAAVSVRALVALRCMLRNFWVLRSIAVLHLGLRLCQLLSTRSAMGAMATPAEAEDVQGEGISGVFSGYDTLACVVGYAEHFEQSRQGNQIVQCFANGLRNNTARRKASSLPSSRSSSPPPAGVVPALAVARSTMASPLSSPSPSPTPMRQQSDPSIDTDRLDGTPSPKISCDHSIIAGTVPSDSPSLQHLRSLNESPASPTAVEVALKMSTPSMTHASYLARSIACVRGLALCVNLLPVALSLQVAHSNLLQNLYRLARGSGNAEPSTISLRLATLQLLHDIAVCPEVTLSDHDRVTILDLLVPLLNARSRLLRLTIFSCFRATFASCCAQQRRYVARRMLPLLRARAPHCSFSEGVIDLLASFTSEGSKKHVHDPPLSAVSRRVELLRDDEIEGDALIPRTGATFSPSASVSSARSSPVPAEQPASPRVREKSWISGLTLLTIRTGRLNCIEITVRRATSASRWSVQRQGNGFSELMINAITAAAQPPITAPPLSPGARRPGSCPPALDSCDENHKGTVLADTGSPLAQPQALKAVGVDPTARAITPSSSASPPVSPRARAFRPLPRSGESRSRPRNEPPIESPTDTQAATVSETAAKVGPAATAETGTPANMVAVVGDTSPGTGVGEGEVETDEKNVVEHHNGGKFALITVPRKTANIAATKDSKASGDKIQHLRDQNIRHIEPSKMRSSPLNLAETDCDSVADDSTGMVSVATRATVATAFPQDGASPPVPPSNSRELQSEANSLSVSACSPPSPISPTSPASPTSVTSPSNITSTSTRIPQATPRLRSQQLLPPLLDPSSILVELQQCFGTTLERALFDGDSACGAGGENGGAGAMRSLQEVRGDKDALDRAIKLLDRTPCVDTHKIGVVYVGPGQSTEEQVLRNSGGSPRYHAFLDALGTYTRLRGATVYAGGLDTVADSDGEFALFWASSFAQTVFHVATLLESPADKASKASVETGAGTASTCVGVSTAGEAEQSESGSAEAAAIHKKKGVEWQRVLQNKKRHIGNDHVCIVYTDHDDEYHIPVAGHFNNVHIVIRALAKQYYSVKLVNVTGIEGVRHVDEQIIPMHRLSAYVRQLACNADLACRVHHEGQAEAAANWEQRLQQIKRICTRSAGRT